MRANAGSCSGARLCWCLPTASEADEIDQLITDVRAALTDTATRSFERLQEAFDMRIYLANRFSRQPQMRELRDRLVALGHEVTSRWIDRGVAGNVAEERVNRLLDDHPELSRPFAEEDLEDISISNALAFIVPSDGGGRGGRHVEFGFALGLGRLVFVVGPRENVFHCLPQIRRFPDVETWIREEM